MDRAQDLGHDRFIVTATTPFRRADLAELAVDAPAVVRRYFPDYAQVYARHGWKMLPALDRVYVNEHARDRLGWQPQYDFARALRSLAAGEDFRSPLARTIGSKGYHR
jgi:UDP-glucose 4-epimerase